MTLPKKNDPDRQLGGDAPLMAAIVTIQTGLTFVTLPVTMVLVQRLMG